MVVVVGTLIDDFIKLINLNFIHNMFSRAGGFGARDHRNPAQLRSARSSTNNRSGTSTGGYNHHQQQQQPWDGSNHGAGGNMWGGDHQAGGAAGYDRFQQQNAGGNGNRQVDHSWWDSTS